MTTRRRVLAHLAACQLAYRLPTYRELAAALEIGVCTAHYHVARLEAAGLVERRQGEARGAMVTERGMEAVTAAAANTKEQPPCLSTG